MTNATNKWNETKVRIIFPSFTCLQQLGEKVLSHPACLHQFTCIAAISSFYNTCEEVTNISFSIICLPLEPIHSRIIISNSRRNDISSGYIFLSVVFIKFYFFLNWLRAVLVSDIDFIFIQPNFSSSALV